MWNILLRNEDMNGSLLVGITGGIGSGKSFVCRKLESLGFSVYYCDDEAKRLMVSDEVIVGELKKLIGENAYNSDGSLNKKLLSEFLFKNKSNANKVNSIVHPRVKTDILRWAESLSGKCLFVESAILFESGFDSIIDIRVLVYAPENVRLHRVMERDNISDESVKKRMDAQMCDEIKRKKSDFCICNDGISDVDIQIKHLLSSIC